ncbi:MAG: ATP-binding protein [Thermoproteota archaeon]
MMELKEKRTEPGEIHPEWFKKTVIEAFKNDPMRIIIELIKNSADSYTRLQKRGEARPPFKIFVKILCRKGSPPYIEVSDHAEGMDSKKLKEALRYGTQTSMGEDIEAVTSAEKGIGLKDAMMALKDNWLITIKDGLINERNKHPDFQTGFGKEDEKVTQSDRKSWEISENGTVVVGELPLYFHERKYSSIYEKLKKHFLLRKLLQNPDYEIYVIDLYTGEKELLRYSSPEKEKQILRESFKINYNGKNYLIHLEISKSKEELKQGKPYGEAGILFYYGNYSVLDFTFCRFEKDSSFSKFFGEARMEISDLIRNPAEAPLVDEKRRGLDTDHPFNMKLFDEISKRLKSIQEEEGVSDYSFDDLEKRKILQELNKMYKEIKGRGPPPEPPIKPEIFEFHPVWADIKEYEPKKHLLIINSSAITSDSEIVLQSNNPKIIVKPTTIKIEKDKIEEDFIMRQIELSSEEAGNKGEIIAVSEDLKHSSKIGVNVLENPMFSPQNGFAFVPDKTTIVDSGKKEVQLCISKSVIGESKEIKFSAEDPISCPGKWLLPDSENLRKKLIKNILILGVPIEVKGTNHIGEKATVTAMYEDKTCNLQVNIVPQPSITGAIRDIRFSKKEIKKISDFTEEGIIEVYYKHPLVKKYMEKKNFKNRPEFQTFIADVITREVVRAFVISGVNENSSRYPIFNSDHPEPEIDFYIIQEYYEKGPIMHEMFTRLAKSLKLE